MNRTVKAIAPFSVPAFGLVFILALVFIPALAPPWPHAAASAAQSANDRAIKRVQQKDGPPRHALVIGNGAYDSAALRNPPNDADDMEEKLNKLGFKVVKLKDAGQREMEEAIRAFGRRLRRGGVGLFYFAGHGVQVEGRNYLVPIGARIDREVDVKYDAVDAGRVLDEMDLAGNGLNIILLDACRDNPFSRSWRGSGQSGDIQILISGNVHIHGDGADAPAAAPAESQIAFAEENGVRPRTDHISGISARSEGTLDGAGAAGAITLSALNILLDDGGRITTAASNAGGGWAEIYVVEILRMSGGRITTSVQKGIGNGGDITIAEPAFLIMNHSEIIARAYEGSGGNIKIKVKDQFIPSSDSVVDASSTLGIDGDIRIESPETDISGGLTVLPASYLDATRWMGTPCAARFDEEVSRFIVEGSEGLPPPFDGVLSGGCE